MEYEITITFKADDKGTAEAYFDIVSSIAPWMVDNVITSMVGEEMA